MKCVHRHIRDAFGQNDHVLMTLDIGSQHQQTEEKSPCILAAFSGLCIAAGQLVNLAKLFLRFLLHKIVQAVLLLQPVALRIAAVLIAKDVIALL